MTELEDIQDDLQGLTSLKKATAKMPIKKLSNEIKNTQLVRIDRLIVKTNLELQRVRA